MGDAPSPAGATLAPKSNLPMLYYGLVVIGTAAIVLALYNLLIIRWCAQLTNTRAQRRRQGPASSWRFPQSNIKLLISSFEYNRQDAEGGDLECSVCLSAFEDGEELKRLPKCRHSFHAACIDMWLSSHMDCPLCRSPVEPPPDPPSEGHSRHGLLGPPLV